MIVKFPNILEILYLYQSVTVVECFWIVSVLWYTTRQSKEKKSYFQTSLSQSLGLFNSFANIKKKTSISFNQSQKRKNFTNKGTHSNIEYLLKHSKTFNGHKFKGFIIWEVPIVFKDEKKIKYHNQI